MWGDRRTGLVNSASEIIWLSEGLSCQFSGNSASFLLSTLSSFRGRWRSAAAVAHDLILVQVDSKCPWQVPICGWHLQGPDLGSRLWCTLSPLAGLSPPSSLCSSDEVMSTAQEALLLGCFPTLCWQLVRAPLEWWVFLGLPWSWQDPWGQRHPSCIGYPWCPAAPVSRKWMNEWEKEHSRIPLLVSLIVSSRHFPSTSSMPGLKPAPGTTTQACNLLCGLQWASIIKITTIL